MKFESATSLEFTKKTTKRQRLFAQVDSGVVPLSNLLEIRAARIKAEIELAEEKE